jgi:hypothetical protein
VTNSPFRSAGCTIVTSTDAGMNALGGRTRGSIRSPLQHAFGTGRMPSIRTAELGDHINGLTKLNGKQLTNGFGAAIQRQNDETKPTVRPEAE